MQSSDQWEGAWNAFLACQNACGPPIHMWLIECMGPAPTVGRALACGAEAETRHWACLLQCGLVLQAEGNQLAVEGLRQRLGVWLAGLNPFDGVSRSEGAAMADDLSTIYFGLGGTLIGIGSLGAVLPVAGVFLASAGVAFVLAGVLMVIIARRLRTPALTGSAQPTAASMSGARVVRHTVEDLSAIPLPALPFVRVLTAISDLDRTNAAAQRTIEEVKALAAGNPAESVDEFASRLADQAGAMRQEIARGRGIIDVLSDEDGTVQHAWDDLRHAFPAETETPDAGTILATVRSELAVRGAAMLAELQYDESQIEEILTVATEITIDTPIPLTQEQALGSSLAGRLAPYRDELDRLDAAVRNIDAIART
ncbi:hypothetical protein ACIA8K_16050 [Catenuloplanes sp. NPDC051500]|uniref:hypothetical protein n=1 Tax=Catenuloplanes sp. NPDC051500 TaxID=3363959 RepID=UPI0037A6BB40